MGHSSQHLSSALTINILAEFNQLNGHNIPPRNLPHESEEGAGAYTINLRVNLPLMINYNQEEQLCFLMDIE